MSEQPLRHVRRFHRTVAEVIGVTGDRFLGRKRPPGESRILWEIGSDGIDVRLLRRRLGLDSGYVSRVLQSLAAQRLVRVRVDRTDRRVRRATLTARGRAERDRLDERSDTLAAGLLQPLSDRQRQRLVAAMTEVERLLRASMVQFAVADPASPDAQWCLEQYFAELDARFEAGFDQGRSIPADAVHLRAPSGLLLLAYAREQAVGCGALKFHRHAPAELKRMWIDPEWRGLGLGARLLAELERHARDAGVRLIRLETNEVLDDAIALYRRAGYTEVPPFNDEPYAHHWFEKRVSHQRRRTARGASPLP
jgi:DNA-binding MarR family transcriptional regulator/ribosomal protein S18 acetylase RimI-like enzyme